MGQSESAIYCIDTSSLVNLRLWRPKRRHAEVWARLDELIREHRLIAPKAVLEEIHERDDALLVWARQHKPMFKTASQDLVRLVQGILGRFPEFIDQDQVTRNADAFVIGLAIRESRTDRPLLRQSVYVVTEEKYAPGRPRIPHVCEAYGLKYLTIHQVFLFEGWHF